MNLIVGLGNPGNEYKNTRHNLGFMVVDALSELYRIPVKQVGCKALWGRGTMGKAEVVLAKPQTYMNLSGMSVLDLSVRFSVNAHDLIVIYDDMDIPLGSLRIRHCGGSGTHNGMKSIIYQLNTEEFPRVRLGIGAPPDGIDAADYVLGSFLPDESCKAFDAIKLACEAVGVIISDGIDEAMNRFN